MPISTSPADCATLLHPGDSVAIARQDISQSMWLSTGLAALQPIPAAHKVAIEAMPTGAPVRKAGRVIGHATRDIAAGEWVHTHNLADAPLQGVNDTGPEPASVLPFRQAWFKGFVRDDGRVGTRNYIAVCIAGNCAATAARRIAEAFTPAVLRDYPNVDGVVPLTHEFGCGMEMTGEPMDLLRRTLAASVTHPNVAAAVVVALGCERNNIYGFLEQQGLQAGPRLRTVVLQEVGGTLAAIEQGIEAVRAMLPLANEAQRTQVPASQLVVGLLSSGLDGHAALGSSPALAAASTQLAAAGGAIVTADTPTVLRFAAEVLARTPDPQVAERLHQRLQWWQSYRAGRDTRLAPHRLPQGLPTGISTMHEQSALSLAALGSLPVSGMQAYGQAVSTSGWTVMDSPAYEAVAATGLIASGATVLCMATGTGSGFGAPLVPTLKLATHSAAFARWQDDLDLDAGVVVRGDMSADAFGEVIFQRWLAHASGQPTANEELGVGQEEFAPWPVGVLA